MFSEYHYTEDGVDAMKAAKAYSAWNFIPPIGFLIVVATVKGDIVLAVILAYLILGVIMA